jgi:hypothetical protein
MRFMTRRISTAPKSAPRASSATANYTSQWCDECGKTFKVEVYTRTSWTCGPLEDTAP